VGGGLLLLLGPTPGLMLNVVFYLPLLVWLWKAPYGPRFRTGEAVSRGPAVRGLADILDTARTVAGQPIISSMVLLSGAAALIVSNAYQAQMPEFGHDLGHGDAGMFYSALLAADAAGALTGGILLEVRGLSPDPRTAFIFAMLWCCAIAGFALSGYYPIALALLFAAGFLELSFNSMAQSLVQMHAPPAIRGRVIGLYNMAALGLRFFSGITVGLAGSVIGIHGSLSISAMALLLLLIALFVRVSPRMRPVPGE
jgi:MFS family permease